MSRRDANVLGRERSIAMHRAIAERLASEPALIDRARQRIAAWRAAGQIHPRYADAWDDVLARPVDEITALLVDRSEEACTLRSTSPFAGAIDPRERWRIHRAVRGEQSADEAR